MTIYSLTSGKFKKILSNYKIIANYGRHQLHKSNINCNIILLAYRRAPSMNKIGIDIVILDNHKTTVRLWFARHPDQNRLKNKTNTKPAMQDQNKVYEHD